METPRLPSPQMHFNSSSKSFRKDGTTPRNNRRKISRKEIILNKSSQSFIDESEDKKMAKNSQLKGKDII